MDGRRLFGSLLLIPSAVFFFTGWTNRKDNYMSNKTIFFADIDGTLVGADFLLREEVVRAAKKYQEAGGKLVLCTGRSVYGTKHIADKLGAMAPAILYNGAVVFDFHRGEILWKRPLDKKIAEILQRIYQEHPGVCIEIFTEKAIYRVRTNWMVENRGVPEERGILYPEIPEIREDILKITLIADHSEELKRCRGYFTDGCSFEFSGRHFAEIVREGCGKHVAAKELMQYWEPDAEMIFAAGNGQNDMELLRQSDYAFVPATAEEKVKEVADRLIDGPEKMGMAEAFETAACFWREKDIDTL